MINILKKIPDNLYEKAIKFNEFRKNCKNYLNNHKMNFDKFTIVDHDSIIGFVSESIVSDYIKNTYSNVEVFSWDDQFDIERITNIINNNSSVVEDIELVRDYFYDQWDLKLVFNGEILLIDVKSAMTSKNPTKWWNFLYPKVQVDKKGKNGAILGYCVCDNIKDIRTLNNFILIGYISMKDVSNCKIQYKGTLTRFGTVSQIDNYITEVSTGYSDLKGLFK